MAPKFRYVPLRRASNGCQDSDSILLGEEECKIPRSNPSYLAWILHGTSIVACVCILLYASFINRHPGVSCVEKHNYYCQLGPITSMLWHLLKQFFSPYKRCDPRRIYRANLRWFTLVSIALQGPSNVRGQRSMARVDAMYGAALVVPPLLFPVTDLGTVFLQTELSGSAPKTFFASATTSPRYNTPPEGFASVQNLK